MFSKLNKLLILSFCSVIICAAGFFSYSFATSHSEKSGHKEYENFKQILQNTIENSEFSKTCSLEADVRSPTHLKLAIINEDNEEEVRYIHEFYFGEGFIDLAPDKVVGKYGIYITHPIGPQTGSEITPLDIFYHITHDNSFEASLGKNSNGDTVLTCFKAKMTRKHIAALCFPVKTVVDETFSCGVCN